jgi:hypothetical protein
VLGPLRGCVRAHRPLLSALPAWGGLTAVRRQTREAHRRADLRPPFQPIFSSSPPLDRVPGLVLSLSPGQDGHLNVASPTAPAHWARWPGRDGALETVTPGAGDLSKDVTISKADLFQGSSAPGQLRQFPT